jgi:predicted Zn-dependent peptidase
MSIHATKKVFATIAVVFCLATGSTAVAQQAPDSASSGPAGQSVKGAELKNRAPINNQTLHIKLPKPIEAKLANGVQVVLIEDHKLPTLYVQCVLLERGDAADAKDLQGVARITAAQLREGTTTRTGRDLSEELDSLGGTLSGSTSSLDTYLTVTGLSEHADKLLDIFSDVLLHPTFPQAELERFKSRFLSQLQAQRATPGFIAREQFYKAVYGDHPASIVAPADDHVKRITVADLRAFHDKFYQPNVALLFVAGDISMKQLLPKLETRLSAWKQSGEKVAPLPEVKTPEQGHVIVVDRPGSVQTSLLMGALGIRGNDPDRYALGVTNQVLGSSAASRLFMNLREDKGYTYGAYSGVSLGRYPGVVVANAEVRTEVTDGAMKEFVYELKRIGSEKVGEVELANAKRAIVGRFALALEDPRTFISNVFEEKIYGFPLDYWDHYAERVDAITPTDVKHMGTKYFDPRRFQIVAVGDAGKIRDVMKKYEAP